MTSVQAVYRVGKSRAESQGISDVAELVKANNGRYQKSFDDLDLGSKLPQGPAPRRRLAVCVG